MASPLPGPAPVVRPAAGTDLSTLTDLVAEAGLPTDGLADAWQVWVATDDGEVVAGCALERHTSTGDEVRAYLLRSLVVTPRMRGRGMGAALVRRALAASDADGGGPVALLTETAVGYVERFGFRSVTRPDLPPALSASEELRGACPATARAYLRQPT